MSTPKKMVLFAAIVLFAVWGLANFGRISADDEWVIRFVLGLLFGAMVIIRPKRVGGRVPEPCRAFLPGVLAVVGVGLSLGGIIFEIHQFEWLGLVVLMYTCLRWVFPEDYCRDILLSAHQEA